MKLEKVLNHGIAPNDANLSFAEAKAMQAFLANIKELGVGPLAVRVLEGSPQNGRMVALTEIEGTIPETAVLEFYLWLGDINDNINTHWHNVRAISRTITRPASIAEGLRDWLAMFQSGLYVVSTTFADEVITKAIVKIWNDAHGIVEPIPVEPPVVVPGNNDPAMPDKEGPMGAKTFFPGVFELEPGDTNPVGFIYVAPDGKKYERLATTWREVR